MSMGQLRSAKQLLFLFLMLILFLFPQIGIASNEIDSRLEVKCSVPPRVTVNLFKPVPILIQDRPKGTGHKMRFGWRPLGMTYFSNDLNVKMDWRKYQIGEIKCIRLNSIQIVIGAAPPRIWLAKDVKADACLKKIVMKHELSHVRNREKFGEHLKISVKKYFSHDSHLSFHDYYRNNDDEPAKVKKLSKKVMTEIEKLKTQSQLKYKYLDQLLDSPENYMSSLKFCK